MVHTPDDMVDAMIAMLTAKPRLDVPRRRART
jgi:hypothetical protein